MEVGVVGLGKMGNQIAQKLSDSNFTVFGYDQDQEIINTIDHSYHIDNYLLPLMYRFTSKKIIWLMVPSGEPTRATDRTDAPGDIFTTDVPYKSVTSLTFLDQLRVVFRFKSCFCIAFHPRSIS